MDQEKLNSEVVTNQAVDWLSTLLSIPLVWPKTTVMSVVAVLALGTGITMMPPPTLKRPKPADPRLLQQMMQAVQEGDQRVRSQSSLETRPDPEMRGVFETLRDQSRPVESRP